MKNIYLIILLFIIGCSNQQDIIQSNQSENVYFSTNTGGVYVYDGTVSKISELPVNSIDSSNTAPLYASTQSFLSFIDRFDNKSNLIKTNDNIITSAVSREKEKVFYFNQFGELKIYNLRNNSTKLTSVKVYPIPKQVVFSESRQQLFFHDNKNIFKVDIHSETVDKLTQNHFPISSIAYDTKSNSVYFSTSTNGRIYRIHASTLYIYDVFHTMSAKGSNIAFSSSSKQLYFSRNNGRDIQIKSLDLDTKETSLVTILYNMSSISNLSVN